jgi:hypothetical protein
VLQLAANSRLQLGIGGLLASESVLGRLQRRCWPQRSARFVGQQDEISLKLGHGDADLARIDGVESCLPSVPSRSPALILMSAFASFAGGPALGCFVADWAAPGSELAQLVSPLAFTLAFVGGLMLWLGIGVLSVVSGALYRLVRGHRHWRLRSPSATAFVPPGYGLFLPLALGFGLAAGVVAGLVPQAISFWLSCAAHLIAGAAYGGALRALARHGYLPFTEPS